MNYDITPEPPADDGSTTPGQGADEGTTAHHQSLIADERRAAQRGNRLVGAFAAVGLVIAAGVGLVAWQSAGPDKQPSHQEVNEAANGQDVTSTVSQATSHPSRPSQDQGRPQNQGTPGADRPRQEPAPQPVPTTGYAPLTDDPFLPPNSWDGGHYVNPGSPEQQAPDTLSATAQAPAPSTAPTTPTTSDGIGLPDLPGISDLPDLPEFPGSGTSSPAESTRPDKPVSPEQPGTSDNPTRPGLAAEPSEPADAPDTAAQDHRTGPLPGQTGRTDQSSRAGATDGTTDTTTAR
ncbi:MAG: hypothetical protein L0K27_07285 [Corynebacterium nuruki]|nr:hypothetical protein [Corynebacterium nuruki]